ncbi:hypothetical protein HWV62_1194 [Athelia sp. TMB]|nr:hypothetical protein HWV62_1194 [Athelia sp. TMB]
MLSYRTIFTVPLAVWGLFSIFLQPKRAIPGLTVIAIALLSASIVVEDAIDAICVVPGLPPICRLVFSYEQHLAPFNIGATSPSKLDTVQDLLVHSFFSNDMASTDLSISDISFLAESSGISCQDMMSSAISRLKEESILMTSELLELSAETSYHLNFLIGASVEMLQQIALSDDSRPPHAFLCVTGLLSCPNLSTSQISAIYVAETLSNMIDSLEPLIDRLDLKLRSLDAILETIRQLLAAESQQAVEGKGEILVDPLYRLGLRVPQPLLQYEARLQAVAKILGFHRSAANHLIESRGRLGSIREELKMLKRIMVHLRVGGLEGLRLRSFVEALRSSMLRLESAQYVMTGGYSGSSAALSAVAAGIGNEIIQLTGKHIEAGGD